MKIYINTLIEYKNEKLETSSIERVLWISTDLKDVVLFNIDEKEPYLPTFKSLTVLEEELSTPYASILITDPFNELNAPDSDYLEKHKKKRDEKWEIIKGYVEREPYIFYPYLLSELVAEIKKKTGKGSKRIYQLFREYWRGGKTINSLLPNYINSGGRGKSKQPKDKKLGRPSNVSRITGHQGVNVSESDKELFEIGIKLFYKGKKNTLKNAFEEIVQKHYISGYKRINNQLIPIALPDEKIPNFRQFLYWYNSNYKTKEKIIHKKGERDFHLNHRPLIGDETNKASGPGDIFEIDATIGDIYLVSELDRSRIIGRPVIYIAKDVYSRMVVGVYVGLEGPSWLAAMMALENTTTDKKEYCKNLGIDIEDEDWPCNRLPRRILADRGELESSNADNLVESLGIQIINTPPYRADLKGIVERHFRIINDKIKQHWMPGVVHKDFHQRGGSDYRLDAKLTLKAFEQVIVLSILEHNNRIINGYPLNKEMMESSLNPTPLNIWNWGIQHRSGLLKKVDKDLIRLNLMQSKEVSITGEGIIFNKMRYSSEVCSNNGWFEKARKKRWKEVVFYDPRNVHQIYLKTKGNPTFIKCQLVESDEKYANFRLEEVQEQQFVIELSKSLEATSQRQLKIDTEVRIKNIIKKEEKSTNEISNGNLSKASKLKNIRENRKTEKEFVRLKEHWGDTLEPENDESNGKIIEMKKYKNSDIQDEEVDYLLNLIMQYDEKED